MPKGGVSLKDTEQLIEPDLTSFLCVLQIWLYCLVTRLVFILSLLGETLRKSSPFLEVLAVVVERVSGVTLLSPGIK